MKNIIRLTITNMKSNRLAVILSVAGAVILCMMLTMLGNMIAGRKTANISVGFLDYDRSVLSEDFKNYLAEDLHYHVIENLTFDQLSAELIDKKLSVIIEVPKDFYQEYASGKEKNVMITTMDDYENAAYVKVYINSYLSSISVLSKGASGNTKTFDQLLTDYSRKDIPVTQTAVTLDMKSYADQEGFINSIGFFLMFIYAVSVIVSFMVLDDRLLGVYTRIQAAPVKPVQYIVGTGIFGLILCLIQVGLYCAYILVMDIHTGVPVHVLSLMMSLFSLFTISFTLAVAVMISSKNAMVSIIFGFAICGCILGGAYFSLELAPKTMQNIARILPQFWFMDAFRRLQTDVSADIYPNIVILVLFSLLFLLIGAVSFAQNYKTN
ncbi:MAG TPA: ABC transporter permease [Mobilitalea sp.]|nr:ABC transporter permease [Mobilitalea sp.]